MQETSIVCEEAGFLGHFFSPNTSAQKVVLVLTGSDGGLANAKDIARVFAAYGYATLALAYWRGKGLPKALNSIPLEFVEHAISWLRAKPEFAHSKIGIYGWSKGAEYALLAATKFHALTCVIGVSPSQYVYEGLSAFKMPSGQSSWIFRGSPAPYIPLKGSMGWLTLRDVIKARAYNLCPTYVRAQARAGNSTEAEIPVGAINGKVLLLSSVKDEIWPSASAGEAIVSSLRRTNFSHVVKHQILNGSHVLVPLEQLRGIPLDAFAQERKAKARCKQARSKALRHTLEFLDGW